MGGDGETCAGGLCQALITRDRGGLVRQLHRNSMSHVPEPHAALPWAGGVSRTHALAAGVSWATMVSQPGCSSPGLCAEPGLTLRGCRPGWLVAVTSPTACFLARPRSRLAGRGGLTINFYWRSAVCTVSVPRPTLSSGPEEAPFDICQAKQLTALHPAGAARPFECPCCHLPCACWRREERSARTPRG